MRKKNIFIRLLLLITVTTLNCNLSATATTLSKDARISILTCSPGAELYSLFGHTAIRVEDPANQFDAVFNYGTFDFNTKGFYLKYAQGLLPYQLTISSYQNFIYSYSQDGRTVYSQLVRLDSLEKQKMFDLLLENHQPENRYYLYNFLFDNCTTRSRDILEKSLTSKVSWQQKDTGKNFWNLLDEYLNVSPWVQWGIHTILGQPGTRRATIYEYMFLPDYLMYGLDSAFYNGEKLVENTKIIYQAPETNIKNPWYCGPFFIFMAGTLLLIIGLQVFKKPKLLSIVAVPLFIFTGLLGCLVIFLGFFTEHPITAPNWNILWANPVNLIALWFIPRKKIPGIVRKYLLIYMILLAVGIPVWFIAQPAVPMASASLIVLMIYICYRLRNKQR